MLKDRKKAGKLIEPLKQTICSETPNNFRSGDQFYNWLLLKLETNEDIWLMNDVNIINVKYDSSL